MAEAATWTHVAHLLLSFKRYLWALGRFQDIRVTTVEHGSAADVVFRVVREPQFTLREIPFGPERSGSR